MAAQYVAIKRISSLDTPITAEKLDGSLFTTENQAHEFIVSVRKNGVKQTVTGSVSGKFIRANGTTIFLQGSIVDGDAVVRLHQDCYNVQGRFTFNIFNTQSGVTTCIYSAVGKIDMGSTETVIDAGDVVPDVSDVVAAQEAAQVAITAANTAAQTANTAAQNVGSIIARPYSSSSTYTAGDYCTNNGNLYKANQDIPTAEEWNASHWTQIVMGDEVTSLKSALDDLNDTLYDLDDTVSDVIKVNNIATLFAEKISGDATLPEGFSTGNGYLRTMNLSNPGNLAGTGSASNRWYSVQATADMDVFVEYISGSSRQLGVFDNEPYGSANRATPIFASNDENHPMPTVDNPVHVNAGQYLTFSHYNGADTLDAPKFKVYTVAKGDAALIATTPLTDAMHTQVTDKIHATMMSGYYHLPVANFARRAWDRNGTSIDNRNYRVRYINPITFDCTIFAVMSEGYTIAGYADGTFFESTSVKKFLPNVEYKIYVRRFTEDSSETADIAEFANALNLATALADINLYKPTFTDVSMFERVGICGDSYAAGGGIISGIRPLTWGKNLERQAGISVDIYAKSGQTVMQWVTDATNGLPALLAGEECGLYWLQHGINGTSTDEQFGSLEDITTYPHPNTFCGQYTEAIEQMKTAFPKARIIMATIIGSNFGLYQSTYAKVNNAIRAIAQHCEVMVVDVADDDFYRSGWYSAWGRSNHPTAMQNPGIAMANRRLISKCIQDNPEYFVNYGVRS